MISVLINVTAFVQSVTSTKTAMPLINCTVNDGLVHAAPNVHQTLLEFISVVQCASNIVCSIQRLFNVNQNLKQ